MLDKKGNPSDIDAEATVSIGDFMNRMSGLAWGLACHGLVVQGAPTNPAPPGYCSLSP